MSFRLTAIFFYFFSIVCAFFFWNYHRKLPTSQTMVSLLCSVHSGKPSREHVQSACVRPEHAQSACVRPCSPIFRHIYSLKCACNPKNHVQEKVRCHRDKHALHVAMCGGWDRELQIRTLLGIGCSSLLAPAFFCFHFFANNSSKKNIWSSLECH